MATTFRFGGADDAKAPVGILQRSLSAPAQEDPNTFLAAVMAAGGNMARSTSVSEYGKSGSNSSVSTPSSVQAPMNGKQAMGSGIHIPSEVDTSLNEDLFFPSVAAAAAVTLSPSFGPANDTNSDMFYPSYRQQSSGNTWGKQKGEMPALGLPKSVESSSQHSQSPRSGEYSLRLAQSQGSQGNGGNVSQSDGGEMYQLRAAMSSMSMGSASTGSGSRGSNLQEQHQPQHQQQHLSMNGMYDPSQQMMQSQMYYQDSYGAMYPAEQYIPAAYNRYAGEMYPPDGMGVQGGRGGTQMMDQRYAFNYAPNSYMPMQDYVPQNNPRGMSSGSAPYVPRGANPYAGAGKQLNNPSMGGRRSQTQQQWANTQQPQYDDGYFQTGGNGHVRNNNHQQHSQQQGGGSQRGSILEDVRNAMRANNSTQRHRVVMNNHQGGGMGGGSYPRTPTGSSGNMYMQQQSGAPMIQPMPAHHMGGGGGGGSAMHYTLADVRGHAVEFAQDQFGSRWLQQQLSSASVSQDDKQALFLELLPAARELAGDTFGNYCVQILLNPQVGTPLQQLQLCQKAFEGNMLALSRNTYACRCIQSLIKLFQLGDAVIPIDLQDRMLHELEKDILGLVTDSNANHVAQQIIERVRPISRITFVLDAFKGRYLLLAKDPYGCRVCQRVLEYATPEYVEPALEELLVDIDDLITDSMGNYVVQHIITASGDRYVSQRAKLVDALKRKLLMYATHKFASNVVEKVLEFGDAPTRRDIIQLMLDGQASVAPGGPTVPMLQVMMSDLFANYVCQRSLAVAERDQLIRLVAIVRANAHDLRRMTYGKHILSACEKAAAAAGIP